MSSDLKKKINSANDINNISLDSNKSRSDRFGNAISKQKKSHKISFKDEMCKDAKLVEINLVDSYREYNRAEEKGNYYDLKLNNRSVWLLEMLDILIIYKITM